MAKEKEDTAASEMLNQVAMHGNSIRIAIVSNFFFPSIGGIELQNQMIGEALVRRGHHVTILTRRYDSSLPDQENLNGLEIRRFGPVGRSVVAKWFLNVGLFWHIGKANPVYDIILVTQFSAHILGAALGCMLCGIPFVIRTDENGEFSGAISVGSLNRLPFGLRHVVSGALRAVRMWALHRADGVLALSMALSREAEAFGFQRNFIALVANAIDLKRFHPVTQEEKISLRTELGISENAEVVAYVARLAKGKGHVTLIEAWADIARCRPRALLLLVGGRLGLNSPLDAEGDLRNAIETFGLHDQVLLTGAVSDVERLLQASDVFVFPSESEAFGMALSEAMACGLPIVCSTIDGGAADQFIEGVHGFRFPIGDAETLREKTITLLADAALRRSMGEQGRMLAERQVNLEPIVDSHEQIFRSAIARYMSGDR